MLFWKNYLSYLCFMMSFILPAQLIAEECESIYQGQQVTAEQMNEVLAQHRLWLKDTEQREMLGESPNYQDKRRANLCGAKLAGMNLPKANLSKANLKKADLSQARLIRANLQQAALGSFNGIGSRIPGKGDCSNRNDSMKCVVSIRFLVKLIPYSFPLSYYL